MIGIIRSKGVIARVSLKSVMVYSPFPAVAVLKKIGYRSARLDRINRINKIFFHIP